MTKDERALNAVRAVLKNHMLTEAGADERARNITQALSAWQDGDPAPYQIIADMLWLKHREVRHFHDAVKQTLRAWTLAQEPTVGDRLSLLADVGVPADAARQFLQTLGLWSFV